jgi:hypothetical protein
MGKKWAITAGIYGPYVPLMTYPSITRQLYNLPSVRGHHVAEELFFDEQLKDHTNTGTVSVVMAHLCKM